MRPDSEHDDGRPLERRKIRRGDLLRFPTGYAVKGYRVVSRDSPDTHQEAVEPIGSGGSGVVFLALQDLGPGVSLRRAVKFFIYRDDIAEMTPHNRTGPVSGQEFLSEVTNISRLSHEYLVKVIDAGTYVARQIEIPFVVTDFIPGPTLKGLMEDKPRLPNLIVDLARHPTDALRLLLQLGEAIAYIHREGFAHCDIAPKNVFVDTRGDVRPVLGDLGVMKDLSADRQSVFVVGSPQYMPPQAQSHLNTELDWATFKKLQPGWDIYGFCKTGSELFAALPLDTEPSWLRALRHALDEGVRGNYGSIGEVIDRIDFLQPSRRETAMVEELSGSVAGKHRRLMPVEVTEVSRRMHRLIRHPSLVRLARVPQVTSVKQLFPGAKHDRYEHSLGVMETVRRYLLPLLDEPRILEHVTAAKLELALLGGLFFNVTRFPFSNIIHEMHQKDKTSFPRFSRQDLLGEVFQWKDRKGRTIPDLIQDDFPRVDIEELRRLLIGDRESFDAGDEFVYSLLSSSLDARVIDFVRRDSLHIGVMRGDAFDLGELLPHLTVENDRLALRSTGVTVAEQILSLRYWLFNRVYWNRPNRAYSSMLRHLLLQLSGTAPFLERLRERVLLSSEDELLAFFLLEAGRAERLDLVAVAEMLTASDQRLYGTVVDITPDEVPDLKSVHTVIGNMNFAEMKELTDRLAASVSVGTPVADAPLFLMDMPFEPGSAKLGDDILVVRPDGVVANLTSFSAIVGALNESFDRHLRRLRVFMEPNSYPDDPGKRGILRGEIMNFLRRSVA